MISRSQFSIILAVAIVLGVIAAFIDIPFWIVICIILFVTIAVSYLPMIINLYITDDMNKIEHYLEARLNQPIFHFYYALANEDNFQIEKALLAIREKYRSSHAVYSVTYAAYKGELASEKALIAALKQTGLRMYYEGLLAIEEGELERATQLAQNQQKPWMKEVILAEIYRKNSEWELVQQHEQEAIRLTRGLQRYILVKKYGT